MRHTEEGGGQTVGSTWFAGRQRPHGLGADLSNRAGPLQLLRVGTRWGFACGGHSATGKQTNTKSGPQIKASLPTPLKMLGFYYHLHIKQQIVQEIKLF